MGLFKSQLSNVVEWEEYKDDCIFWKWTNKEIKKGSRLIIRPGQDAIFLYNGKIEGIFKDEGEFDIESQIIPFLSTLKGFKFGFNSGMRAEVLFVNTKEFNVNWGTKNPIAIPAANLPGGMPIRAVLDQLLMKWITKEGKDMFNLQANAFDISSGIKDDLDMQMSKLGIEITDFNIASFSYPEEIQKMQNKAASQSMVADMGKYSQVAMADNIGKGGNNIAGDMMSVQMGMAIGQQMMKNVDMNNSLESAGTYKFCPNCGTPANGAKFCSNCGTKLS